MRGTWLFICVSIGIVGCASEPTNAPDDPAQDHALEIGEPSTLYDLVACILFFSL